MLLQTHLLTLQVVVPLIGGILLLATRNEHRVWRTKLWGLVTSLISLGLGIYLYCYFDNAIAGFQFEESHRWVPLFNIYYALGVDGISLPLVLLTQLLTLTVMLAAWQSIQQRVAEYYAAFLIMESVMIGVFLARDAMLFYVFWEAMLIPMFLIIGIWGGPNRIYATVKFFLYTFLGSVFLLVSFLYLYSQSNSFVISDFYSVPLSMTAQILIFVGAFLAFAVKIPMWPVHTWLPDAHVEAPTGGSVILAAIMLKMGGYGFIRLSMPIVPDASRLLAPVVIGLSLIAVIYIGMVAIVQRDMKKLIAYSSIAHMGFVTLGLFVVYAIVGNTQLLDDGVMALQGAMVQMISHGFISGALFLCVGVLYDRLHSRNIADYGGVANSMPMFAAFFMLFALANAGLPGTSGFVGEFLVIVSTVKANFWFAVLASATLILGPAYTLWMYKRVIFGETANARIALLPDLQWQERWVLGILAAMVLLFGIWPAPLTNVMNESLSELVPHLMQTKIAAE
jgi:NADH-quinone oxidoreductase subunit M